MLLLILHYFGFIFKNLWVMFMHALMWVVCSVASWIDTKKSSSVGIAGLTPRRGPMQPHLSTGCSGGAEAPSAKASSADRAEALRRVRIVGRLLMVGFPYESCRIAMTYPTFERALEAVRSGVTTVFDPEAEPAAHVSSPNKACAGGPPVLHGGELPVPPPPPGLKVPRRVRNARRLCSSELCFRLRTRTTKWCCAFCQPEEPGHTLECDFRLAAEDHTGLDPGR